jgi:hypothetical protein
MTYEQLEEQLKKAVEARRMVELAEQQIRNEMKKRRSHAPTPP